jgi:retron-type reverse transcriptase
MHYAFDRWMAREFPGCPWERYADDAVVHCANQVQANRVLAAIAERMEEVGLRLHPDKTAVVYCKDGTRRGDHEHTSFTFLGHADLRVMPTSAETSLSEAATGRMGSA